MKLVVLLSTLFDAFGGIPTFNRCLVKALDELARANRWDVTVLALNDRRASPIAGRYLTEGVTRYRGFGRRRVRFVRAAVLAGLKADLVIFGHVHLSPLACAMTGVSRHLIVHGVEVWKKLPLLQRLGAARMHRILSVSRFTRDEMARHNNVALDRFSIFPNTLDPFFETEATWRSRAELGLPPGRMLLTVSRLDGDEAYKGVDAVIEAMPAVLSRAPDAFYVVVGDGTDLGRLRSLSQAAGVTDRVHFTGLVPARDLPSYYEHCDVFVLPSRGEGFGIVFLEAMRLGKPCVGVRAGAIPEVLEDGATGLVVEPDGDAPALAAAIAGLLQDESARAKMGQAGRERFDREFSFETFKARLGGLLCT